MIELTRTVRFFLNDPSAKPPPPCHNTFAAWPPARGLGRFYQLQVCCRGETNANTGLFLNIKYIDEAVRDQALDCLRRALADSEHGAGVPMGSLMRDLFTALRRPLQSTVCRLRLDLSPFYSLMIGSTDMAHVILTQQYEFAAAHRLHVDRLGDEENRRLFGKCNNPSGHGHNYRVEVALRVPIRGDGSTLEVEKLDGLVNENAIGKLDHKNLNLDVPEFQSLNTSVENIAKVIYDMLADDVSALGADLESVSVWETSKTVCTYRSTIQ